MSRPKGYCFVLAIDPEQHVTTFCADVGEAALTGPIDHFPRIERSTTSSARYDKVLAQFGQRPEPTDQMLEWGCRGNLSYLDLARDRVELVPR